MTPISHARVLADYIASLPQLQIYNHSVMTYGHIGATLADAGLQAALNYRTVVAPRIARMRSLWPAGCTTSGFLHLIEDHGLRDVLQWPHPEKPRRIHQMAVLLFDENVETEAQLADWLLGSDRRSLLLDIHGIGPKTLDYLCSLVGVPAIAIDRHLVAFAARAGITDLGYDEMGRVYRFAADLLSVDYCALDRAVWTHMSSEPRPQSPDRQLWWNF